MLFVAVTHPSPSKIPPHHSRTDGFKITPSGEYMLFDPMYEKL